MISDHRRRAPAAARNREPILAVLRDVLPPTGLVLEVASGTGEHAVHFARSLPDLSWQPSDPDPDARASIAAWRKSEAVPNMLAPIPLDAAGAEWPLTGADAVVCINMIHISPWQATEGLMAGAARLLGAGQPLFLYGPFRQATRPVEPSNQAFDDDLRCRDPRWGLRQLEDVGECAKMHGFALDRIVDMPANNLSVVFRKF